MARVSTYLNFLGSTEEAFEFYRSVFGGEFTSFTRMSEIPPMPDQPALSEREQNMVMHIELPTLGDHVLMGTDALESMGHTVEFGNNISINLEPNTREETATVTKKFDVNPGVQPERRRSPSSLSTRADRTMTLSAN